MAEPLSGKDFTCARMMWLDQVNSDREMTLACCKVAYHLSAYFNRKHFLDGGGLHAWPSHGTLATASGCTEKTVRSAIKKLRDHKHVETTGGRGRSCTTNYRAFVKPKVAETQPNEAENAEIKTRYELPINDEKSGNSSTENRYLEPLKLGKNYRQPLLNKSLNKNTGASERESDPVTLHPRPVEAQCEPYNPEWALVVFEGLSKGPGALPRPATAFLRKLIEIDQSPLQILDHQARHGWPEINRMFEWPKALDLASVPPVIRPMALEMEIVASGSALWVEWRNEFEARGWPFPREAARMAFPRGGSRALPGFLTAMQARKWGYPDKVVSQMSRAGSG